MTAARAYHRGVAHFLDLDDPDDRSVLLSVVSELMDKQQRERPGISFEFGTVTSHGAQAEQALSQTLLRMAGDPENHNVPAVTLLPNTPARGARVGVLHVPPHGRFVIGTTAPTLPCGAAKFPMRTGITWGSVTPHALGGLTVEGSVICTGYDLNDSQDGVALTEGLHLVSAGAQIVGSLVAGDQINLEIQHEGTSVAADGLTVPLDNPDGVVWMNTQAVLIDADDGDEVTIVGGVTGTTNAVIVEPSNITVWRVCCDDPQLGEGPPE